MFRRYPAAAIAPLLLFVTLVALGTYGVMAGVDSVTQSHRRHALTSATDVGTSLTLQVRVDTLPM